MAEKVLISTWEMTRDKPPLPEIHFIHDKAYWDQNGRPGTEVDYDELVRLGYFEEREVCPTCNGAGYLPIEEKPE